MVNEKRLIDAKRLRFEANRFFRDDSRVQDEVDSLICMMPTVDAVEVVRCKDCHFIIDRMDGTHGCYRHFMEDCKLDDFCSCGERKDNG